MDFFKLLLFVALMLAAFWWIEGITPQDEDTIREEVNLGWR